MLRARVLVLLLVLGVSAEALAEGWHFPEPAHVDVAGIPAQRALIAFRDGTETLIVESAFETESPGAGWVIPLPSVPDEIGAVSPGSLKTLTHCLQPPSSTT